MASNGPLVPFELKKERQHEYNWIYDRVMAMEKDSTWVLRTWPLKSSGSLNRRLKTSASVDSVYICPWENLSTIDYNDDFFIHDIFLNN